MNILNVYVRKAPSQFYISTRAGYDWERISKKMYYQILDASTIGPNRLHDDGDHEKFACALIIDDAVAYRELNNGWTWKTKQYLKDHPESLKPDERPNLISFEELFT